MDVTEHSVMEFGALGDGIADDFPALQRAFDSGSRLLYIPAGKYLVCGTLVLRSHTTLRLHSEATLVFGDHCGRDAGSYLLTNEPGAEGITVIGGIYNGNADNNPRRGLDTDRPYLGVMIDFRDLKGLRLSRMILQDSQAFHLRLNYVSDFVIEHIRIEDQSVHSTQDGIHIAGGCENGIIRHITAAGPAAPNDDMISLISDISFDAMMPEDPARGQRPGDIRNIVIHDITADNTFSFLRLFSWKRTIENISVSEVSGGCYYIGLQLQISPYLRNNPSFDPSSVYGVGNIRNVRISNWNIYFRSRTGKVPIDWEMKSVNGLIDIEQSVTNLLIEDFCRDLSRDLRPGMPMLHLQNMRRTKCSIEAGPGTRLTQGGEKLTLRHRAALERTVDSGEILELHGNIDRLNMSVDD